MIREATLEDMTEMGAMLLSDRFWESVQSFMDVEIDVNKGKLSVNHFITSEEGMVYLAIEDNKIVGMIIGELITNWFNYDKYTTDYALYVHSDYRHKNYGWKLLKHFVIESKKKGAKKFVTLLPHENFSASTMDKLLIRHGFKIKASAYEKDL